ncbi:conserved protein of unknown function [Tenacibaculum sp. 190524A02b]|uniref:DUF6261 family protein n=1 Tax=Tenacibaculum vairaonense TaxID=3137860 RepID=UPI0032B2AF8A
MINLYLNRYRHGEYIQYMRDVISLLNNEDTEALQLKTYVNTLTEITNSVDAAYKQSKASEMTPEVEALDTKRDRAIVGIRKLAITYTYHYNEVLEAAGTAITKAIDIYGKDITKKSYQEETAIISSIVKDIEASAELTAAIATLDASDWLVELKQKNSEFEKKYLERVKESAANPLQNVPGLRDEGKATYKELIKRIQAHAILSDNALYAEFVAQIDVLTSKYNQVVDNRSKNNTGGAEPDEDPTDDV